MTPEDWDRIISIVKAQRTVSWQRGDPPYTEMDASSFKVLLIEELVKEKAQLLTDCNAGHRLAALNKK